MQVLASLTHSSHLNCLTGSHELQVVSIDIEVVWEVPLGQVLTATPYSSQAGSFVVVHAPQLYGAILRVSVCPKLFVLVSTPYVSQVGEAVTDHAPQTTGADEDETGAGGTDEDETGGGGGRTDEDETGGG